MAVNGLPKHLERYAVEQDYSRYTPVDQAVWRHIMRQLRSFLATHAHPCYIDGLTKTGISVDSIPRIDVMNEKLEKFGWRAVPVSGFIPPAAFMELQSLGVLPIASDMRSLDHLLYTPAPDIVHEAAGHAPILIDPAFAHYLKSYAQVARKAILSKEDIDQYEAIRVLSDVKENPGSTASQIKQAEAQLNIVTSAMKNTSEAAILGRMNWWTAEYGLIGDLAHPKIFGAGLLSSVGESRSAMSSAVKKIPLSIDCINYAYDITEQQPQLFVVSEFEKLGDVLEELARTMAFRRGGIESLEKVRRSETVNTVELDSGLQISGTLKSYVNFNGEPAYLSFNGPTQLALNNIEIEGQGANYHRHGFGSPVGRLRGSQAGRSAQEIFKIGVEVRLEFESGIVVAGRVTSLSMAPLTKQPVLVSLANARATLGDDVLFDPSWGVYDMALGTSVVACYGGPADRAAYGDTDDFIKQEIPRPVFEDRVLARHTLYASVRKLRDLAARDATSPAVLTTLKEMIETAASKAPNDWLIHTELLEIAENLKPATPEPLAEAARINHELLGHLQTMARSDGSVAQHIADARKTLHANS